MGISLAIVTEIVLVAPLVTGILLLRRGIRGARIDDHPVCRVCGFDLFGAPAASERCDECGADITRPRAVLNGHRRRSIGLISAGLAAATFSLTSAGGLWWSEEAGFDLNRIKPVWWLCIEGASEDPAASQFALAELDRRLANGTLSDAQIAHIADSALAHQRNTSARWRPTWGRLVEQAYVKRRLPSDRWESYARTAAQGFFEMSTRARVRRGDALPVRLKWNTPRAAASIPLDLDLQSTSLSIDGIALGPAPGMPLGSRPMFVGFNGATGFEQPLESLLASGLAEGPHELQYRMTYLVRSGANPPVPLIVEMRAPWTLVPATENTVTLRADEKLRRIIEDRIVVEDLYRPSDRDQRMNATIAVDHLPIAVAFDVLFRYGGREYPLGTVSFDADQRSGLHAEGPVDDLRPRRGDIVLRPSEAAARRTIGIETIWDGEIIVRNVPIRVTATQPQPTTVH